jgi:hypothetical protein
MSVPSVRSRVGRGEAAVQVAAEAHVRQGGRLVDDRVGPGGGNRLADRRGIQDVEYDRLGAERAQPSGLAG